MKPWGKIPDFVGRNSKKDTSQQHCGQTQKIFQPNRLSTEIILDQFDIGKMQNKSEQDTTPERKKYPKYPR
jgi:hypothetical protein